jgi:hypothetical protein
MKKSLLVGSTFRDACPDQLQWLDLQLRYLRATMPRDAYSHCCVVNEKSRVITHDEERVPGDLGRFGARTTVIDDGSSFDTRNDLSPTSGIHIRSLNRLLAHFKDNQHRYEYFLFLDGDAFPIRNHWFPLLSGIMTSWGRSVAVVVRSEALERRWHASVLLVHHSALDLLRFSLDSVEGGNMASLQELDVGIGSMQTTLAPKVFPLIRTNRYNLHPISYGIYYDTFYHHGFGCKRHVLNGKDLKHPWYSLRGESAQGYSSHYIDRDYPWEQYNEDLMNDPQAFIGKLAGWSPRHYADLELERRNWY